LPQWRSAFEVSKASRLTPEVSKPGRHAAAWPRVAVEESLEPPKNRADLVGKEVGSNRSAFGVPSVFEDARLERIPLINGYTRKSIEGVLYVEHHRTHCVIVLQLCFVVRCFTDLKIPHTNRDKS